MSVQAVAVLLLTLPAYAVPALAAGPGSSLYSIVSCIAKVSHEAQLCTGPKRLRVTTAPTCRLSKFLAKVELPIL